VPQNLTAAKQHGTHIWLIVFVVVMVAVGVLLGICINNRKKREQGKVVEEADNFFG